MSSDELRAGLWIGRRMAERVLEQYLLDGDELRVYVSKSGYVEGMTEEEYQSGHRTGQYVGIPSYELVDEDAIRDEHPKLLRFLDHPLTTDIGKGEAEGSVDTILSHPEQYLNASIYEEADTDA